MFTEKKNPIKIIFVIFFLFLHALIFRLSFASSGLASITIGMLPILFGVWAFNKKGGIIISFLAVFVNLISTYQLTGEIDFSNRGITVGNTFLILVGTFMGWARDNDKGLKEELEKRKKTEKKLEEAESWYRDIFDGISDAVFVETTKGEILDVNQRACEIFGWTREEFLTKTVRDMVPPEYQALLPEEQDESTLSEVPFETINMRANGEYFPVSVSGRVQIMGEEKRLLIVLRDITEWKNIENRLRTQHQFLSHVIESLSEPFYVINVEDYSIEIANSAALGKKSLESAKTCYALTHNRNTPCRDEDYLCPLKEVVKNKENIRVEHLHYDENGEAKNFEVHGYPIFDGQGNVKQIIEYSVDITERKKAEADLRKLSSAIMQSPSSIVTTDLNGTIEYVNPAFTKITGYTPEEAIGKNPRVLKSGIHDDKYYRKLWDTLKAGKIWQGELCNKTKSGELIWESASIMPVKNTNGEVTHYVAVKEDITRQKQFIIELKKAKEDAESASQAKAEFLANMSHEIRTPMNGVIGMLDIALDTNLNAEQKEYLTIAQQSAEALLTLLNDILDYSKIEAKKLDLEIVEFDLRNVVEGVAATIASRAEEKGLELASFVPPNLPTHLLGDPGRLRQILINLLGNAIKFTKKGEVVVRTKAIKETKEDVEVCFSVQDTGIGIKPDRIDAVFERFMQADGSTTRKFGGTGLGLSISQSLIEAMGGKMSVESEYGKGSTFSFTLGFKKQAQKEGEAKVKVTNLRELNILIVDDNATNRIILKKMIESFGAKAYAVESGQEGLDALLISRHARSRLYDIVLLDMQMPDMDGEQTARAIFSDPRNKNLSVVVLTSMGKCGDARRLQDLGCAGYLLKPIKQQILFDALVTVMNEKKDKLPGTGRLITRHLVKEEKSQKQRILLAEDNLVNQKVAMTLLQREGHWVDIANNGKEALEKIKKNQYSLVLMDVQMPLMDGFEASRQIRAWEVGKSHTPIIAMTAHAMKGDRERCLDAGMDDYISKPIDKQSLFATIERWGKKIRPKNGALEDFTNISVSLPEMDIDKKDVFAEKPLDTPPSTNELPLDIKDALPRFGNDREFFNEMYNEFLQKLPKQIGELNSALSQNDTVAINHIAHSMKGMSATFSAKEMTRLSKNLESQSKKGDLTEAKTLLKAIEIEAKALADCVDEVMAMG